jgi:hypothetical protein
MRRHRLAQFRQAAIGGYWLERVKKASAAACRTSSGPSPSGKPCPRLIAPPCRASIDISSKTVVGRPA